MNEVDVFLLSVCIEKVARPHAHVAWKHWSRAQLNHAVRSPSVGPNPLPTVQNQRPLQHNSHHSNNGVVRLLGFAHYRHQ